MTMAENNENKPVQDENQIIAERRNKLRELRTQGQAFPNDYRRSHLAADLRARYDAKSNEDLEPLNVKVAVGGRMMLKRVMGKASFATLQDGRDCLLLNGRWGAVAVGQHRANEFVAQA